MLSMPIPAAEGERGVSLKEIKWGKKSYYDQVQKLYPKLDKLPDLFHFDPDLNAKAKKRSNGWLPAFGQTGAAEGHLRSEKVKEGDIFLFFGSFVHTYHNDSGMLTWEKEHEFHAIFGYLEIGEIIESKEIKQLSEESPYWDHPHCQNRDNYGDNNAIYIATKKLGGTDLPGAGTFEYQDHLRLTIPGYKKSQWSLPKYFHPDKGPSISRCSNLNRFRKLGDKVQFEAVSLGQDMVVNDPSGCVQEWAINLIAQTTN